jgi:hypothetical protein
LVIEVAEKCQNPLGFPPEIIRGEGVTGFQYGAT